MLASTRALRAVSGVRAAAVAFRATRALATEAGALPPTNINPEFYHKAVAAFLENPDSFKNKPLDSVEIVSVDSRPFFSIDGNQPVPALLHLTPFAVTGMCHFGPKGNFGVERRFPSGVVRVDNLTDAAQEIALSDIDPLVAGQQNQLMAEYVLWLHGLQSKLIEHIASNLDDYPALKRKYDFLQRDDDTTMLRDGLMSSTSKISNTWEGRDGDTIEFVTFKQPVYIKKRDEAPSRIFSEADREVADTHRRLHVRVFDEAGVEVPVDDAVIRRGDVISCSSTIQPFVYNVAGNVGITLRKRMRNITRIHKRERMARTPSSPYGKLSE